MKTTTVRILVQIDTDAVQKHLPLERWADMLKLGGVDEGNAESGPRAIEPDWEGVYEKIAEIWIGAQMYKGYSQTAIDDIELMERFVVNEGVSLVDDTPTPASKPTRSPLPMVAPTKKNGNGK